MSTFWSNMICAAASVTLAAGIVAYADPAVASTSTDGPPRLVLHFDAAKASTAAGRAEIERHIRLAADQVCDMNDAGARIAEARCREQAESEAKQQLTAQIAMRTAPAVQIAGR